MQIKISNVSMRYGQEGVLEHVEVLFNARNEEISINSGNFKLTAEEYAGNETIDNLEVIAKDRLLKGLNTNGTE